MTLPRPHLGPDLSESVDMASDNKETNDEASTGTVGSARRRDCAV